MSSGSLRLWLNEKFWQYIAVFVVVADPHLAMHFQAHGLMRALSTSLFRTQDKQKAEDLSRPLKVWDIQQYSGLTSFTERDEDAVGLLVSRRQSESSGNGSEWQRTVRINHIPDNLARYRDSISKFIAVDWVKLSHVIRHWLRSGWLTH